MHVVTLHPLDLETVRQYIRVIKGDESAPTRDWPDPAPLRDALERARAGQERAANQVTLGLARALSASAQVYGGGIEGLSFWEAQVDRPLGMLMRPPSRLFMDAGLDSLAARAMPIRLDPQLGTMGGAWIPARLIDQAYALLDEHLERSVKRLVAAEFDPVPALALMYAAIGDARSRGLGLYEAMDLMGPAGEGLSPGGRLVLADRRSLDPEIAARIEVARQVPKQPGFFSRLFGRGSAPPTNGRGPA